MRRRAAEKRKRKPDPLFKSELISLFINVVMRKGKKSVAEGIVYGALEDFYAQIEKSGKQVGGSLRDIPGFCDKTLQHLEQALNNIRPVVEVKSRRVGGSTYQVPCSVPMSRRTALAFRWLIEFAKGRKSGNSIMKRLSAELLDAYHNRGNAVKKRENLTRMASANAAYSHYNWVSEDEAGSSRPGDTNKGGRDHRDLQEDKE